MQKLPVTTHDVKVIRQHYATEGTRGVILRLRKKRSPNAVRLIARRLGVPGPVARPHLGELHAKLTEEQRNAIRYDCERYFPGRTPKQIAERLNVSRRTIYHLHEQGRHWPETIARGPYSAQEIEVLRRHYPTGGYRAVVKHLPAYRTFESVHGAVRRLGIPGRKQRITPDLIAKVHAMAAENPSPSNCQIGRTLTLSESTVRRILRKGQ